MVELKFEFARMWCGYEIWELKDELGNVLGDVDIKKTDSFFSIYNIHAVDSGKGYGSYMYEKIKKEAIKRDCKWVIGEWMEINEDNKHFLNKIINKEGFRLMSKEDIEKIDYNFPNQPCYIKELNKH